MKPIYDSMTAHDANSLYNPHTRAHAHTGTRADNHYIRKCCHVPSCRHTGLTDIANAVQRLTPDRRDPERFHAEKSEIVAALRRLAREITR